MIRYELILRIEGKTNDTVRKTLKQLVETEIAADVFKSITANNK